MARDLFEEFGINPNSDVKQGRDLFAEAGIKPEPEKISPLKSLGVGAKTALQEFGHGVIQPFLENQYNPFEQMEKRFGQNPALNIRRALQAASPIAAQKRQEEYEASKQENPLATQIGYYGTNIAPAILGGAYTKARAAAQQAPKYLQYLQGILGGGLTGGAEGAMEYLNPEESKAYKIGRGATIGAGIPAAFGAVPFALNLGGKAFKFAKNTPKALDTEANISQYFKDRDLNTKANSNMYELFHEGAEGVIPEIPKKLPLERLKNALDEGEFEAISDLLNSPNSRTWHEADKTLRYYLNGIDPRGLVGGDRKDYEAVKNAQKLLSESMYDATKKSKNPRLYEELKFADSDFKKNVLPYRNPITSAYEKGDLTDADFMLDLSRYKPFKKKLAPRYPAFMVREKLPLKKYYLED